jgi:hypothetical protein
MKKSRTPEFTFSTETDIYITPQGDVIVADLPAELQAALEAIGPRVDDAWHTPKEKRQATPCG